MRPRQDIIEIFSTFLQFDADRFKDWAIDSKLRRSMRSCLDKAQPETSENFWALYWHKVWQTQSSPLAKGHLSAYLQEACYWAANKTTTSFASTQYLLSDCFQMAFSQIDKVLEQFNSKQSFTLKSYASVTFSNTIKEILRQRQEVDICTPWGLLNKLSKKRLVESLQNAGLTKETIARYVLAWTSFKNIYVPTQVPNRATSTRKLPKPDRATWSAIAKLYNAERHSQLNSSEPECSPEVIEKWMTACATAARSYLHPTVISINTPKLGQEQGELLDDLPDKTRESFLTELLAEEDTSLVAQINTVLIQALEQLDPQAQQLLQLYYAQGLTQKQMAQQLEMNQTTVSRRLTKSEKSLLLALVQWSQEALHISLSLDVIKYTSKAIEEWLEVHYSQS